MVGPCIALSMGCMGSAIGCGIAIMASHGVMHYVKEGLIKFVGISFLPSTQSMYGIVALFQLKAKVLNNSMSPLTALGAGIFVGSALMLSAIFQGKSVASAIEASAKNGDVFGKAIIGPGSLEAYALLALVFGAILL